VAAATGCGATGGPDVHVPVRLRLTLAFVLVMAVVLTAAGLFVHGRLTANLDSGIASTLRSRSADVAALAQQSDSGLKEARPGDAIARRAQLAQIVDERGRVIDWTAGLSSRPLVTGGALAAARAGAPVSVDARLGDQPVRLLAAKVRAQGQDLVVVVGQSLEDRNRALSDLTGVLLVGGPLALLLASLAGYLLTGAALRPVEAMRRRAAEISATDLDARLPPSGDDELGRLGKTLNEMLARIQAAMARERTFVSDASHELRTPLAMVRTELELIARDLPTGPALASAAQSAIEETDRLARLAGDLLLLTRADHGGAALRTSELTAAELLDAAARRALRRSPSPPAQVWIDDPEGAAVVADPDRVGQALDNMIDNALRYARTSVELTARSRDGFVELHVIDDGPGFPPEFLPQAWERFARADSGRTEDGVGLGLAIVRTIAELHGGSAGALNRPGGGGADVWLAVPTAASARRRRPGPPAPAARRRARPATTPRAAPSGRA
jgi:two-component system OmpR family sensor kinase